MNTRANSFAALLALVLALLVVPLRAVVDIQENGGAGDGIGDIWQLKYNAAGLAPTADTDGDGRTNAEEAGAGTDPLSPSDIIEVRNMELVGSDLTLHWPSQLGKRYKVQTTTDLTNANSWSETNADFIQGTGADLSVTLTAGATGTFYRVAVYDKDSDGDGVSDWEEHVVGLDPENAYTHGSSGIPDLQWLTAAITGPSTIQVYALDNLGTEPVVGSPATDVASFVITRSGGIKAVTVNYTMSGPAQSGTDYEAVSGSVTFGLGVNSVVVQIAPKGDAAVESPEAAILTLAADANYVLGGQRTAAVIINDRTSATGNGLRARFYNEATNLNPNGTGGVAPAFTNQAATRIDPVVDYTWADSTTKGVGSPDALVNTDYFACRWTGEVLPAYSQVYTFTIIHNRCARLWVNGQLIINKWPNNGDSGNNASGTSTGAIELAAGVRYPIVVEHFETTGPAECHLRWSSTNQPDEVIPTNRLFADSAPQITSSLEVLLIKDSGPYSYQIAASGSPTSYSASNLPAGWSVNSVTGVISGSPTAAGEWLIPITATNTAGSGSAVLHLSVLATGGAIARDVWTSLPGTSVSTLPLGLPPQSTANVSSLEGPQNSADDYGARIRGYITAPTTGIYKFFLAASDAAELYVSNDEDPVNSFKRAEVTSATGYRDWANANAGKSPLLWLDAGRQYYVEVRHKAGVGNDHVSVGWLKPGEGGVDPSSATAPSEVVPGYVLSPYVPPAPTSGESTLYVTNLSAQGGAVTSGFGSASLRLSADEAQAVLAFTYSNLTTPVVAKHIHSDAHGGEIIFDIDTAVQSPDGSYAWPIKGVGAISAQDIINVIKGGQAYLNVHSSAYPNGEIRGNFRLAAASQTFTPPAAQTWSDPNNAAHPESSKNRAAAARFLNQTTFGTSGVDADADGNPDDIQAVQANGFEAWLNAQFNVPKTSHYDFVFANRNQTDGQNGSYTGTMLFNSWWRNSIVANDQLRQRVAFALSEILVVSENTPLDDRADAISDYYDMLLDNAFGNFRDVLINTTLHPAMGRYLDMLRNDKPDKARGLIPNENYAREILQLFSIGLYRMHPDGSLMLNSKGVPIDTYDQNAIIGFAHAFTGWEYNYTGALKTSFNASSNWIDPMREVPLRHFTGPKRLLNNVVIPGLPVLNGVPLDPYAAHSSTEYNMPAYQALPMQELNATHDAIFNHPNVGPFICRQLIQRLVTSTPSRGYLYRVVSKFNDNGSGVRGDMKAVIKAIFLDYEARSVAASAGQGFGKQREPVCRITAIARAFPAPNPVPGTYSQDGSLITVTTSAPHLYSSGNTVYVDFDDSITGAAGQPTDALYSVTVTGPNSFTLRTKSFETAAYQQSGGMTVFTTTGNGFFYSAGSTMHVEYVTGTPLPANGPGTIQFRSSDELKIAMGGPTSKVSSIGALAATATTMTFTVTAHGYAVGASVQLDFIGNTQPVPTSGLYTITAVTTNTFTVARTDTVATNSATVFVTPAADVPVQLASGTANLSRPADFATRTGPLAVAYSDWNMGSSDTDLNQTPLRSPTVFNFFLPDYQFPGILATAGLITPEFQLTSETSVIRQANFIYDGIFNDSLGQRGLASFRTGGRDIMVDLRPWITGLRSGLPWCHNSNVNALIDELNTRLMGGQLPAGAKSIISTYVQSLAYTTPTVSDPVPSANRDRVRALVHLLVTSPDFTIQK